MKQSFLKYLQLEAREISQSPIMWFRWQKLQRAFVTEHCYCEMCGWTKKLNVHHIVPRHVDSSKALEWSNLITLCRECHFRFGHFLNWRSYNPYIVELVNTKHQWSSIAVKYIKHGEDIVIENMGCIFCGEDFILNTDDFAIDCKNGHSYDPRGILRW